MEVAIDVWLNIYPVIMIYISIYIIHTYFMSHIWENGYENMKWI